MKYFLKKIIFKFEVYVTAQVNSDWSYRKLIRNGLHIAVAHPAKFCAEVGILLPRAAPLRGLLGVIHVEFLRNYRIPSFSYASFGMTPPFLKHHNLPILTKNQKSLPSVLACVHQIKR